MADDAPNPDETPITFNVKSSSEAKYVITIPLTTTVIDLKTKLSGSDYADIPPDRQRLIYSGRVLKDADTLASYKIKEGNTVHLVKGAASNVRQQPGNQGASTGAGAGTSPAQGAQGVPQNLASGTGRDPLAGLTGARYAGYAQMPNANMFGPDGGMGPPPDPDQMASMLENPNFQSTLSEALANPDVVDQMIRSNPMLQGMGPQVRQMMQDPNFRRMMTDPQQLRRLSQMGRQFGGGGMFGGMGGRGPGGEGGFPAPGVTDTMPESAERTGDANTQQTNNIPQPPPSPFAMFGNPGAAGGAGAGAAGANPFAALFGQGGMGGLGGLGDPAAANTSNTPSAAGGNEAPGSTPNQQPANPFASMAQNLMQNPQMMQQMMGAMGGMPGQPQGDQATPGSNSAANAGFNPFAALQAMGMAGGAPPAPQDDRAPEDRYAEQLRQLNDMGFYEFERNVEALRRTGGSVQGAVEYLLTH